MNFARILDAMGEEAMYIWDVIRNHDKKKKKVGND